MTSQLASCTREAFRQERSGRPPRPWPALRRGGVVSAAIYGEVTLASGCLQLFPSCIPGFFPGEGSGLASQPLCKVSWHPPHAFKPPRATLRAENKAAAEGVSRVFRLLAQRLQCSLSGRLKVIDGVSSWEGWLSRRLAMLRSPTAAPGSLWGRGWRGHSGTRAAAGAPDPSRTPEEGVGSAVAADTGTLTWRHLGRGRRLRCP